MGARGRWIELGAGRRGGAACALLALVACGASVDLVAPERLGEATAPAGGTGAGGAASGGDDTASGAGAGSGGAGGRPGSSATGAGSAGGGAGSPGAGVGAGGAGGGPGAGGASAGTTATTSSGGPLGCAEPYVGPGCAPGADTAPACGPAQEDCCVRMTVPGGVFDRGDDPSYPATVSAFQLDVYEVTVGRFRAFVDAGRGTQLAPPGEGEGAHPALPGSGWSPAWVGELAPGSDALRAALACSAYATWTDEPCAHEALPINCVTWYEALAFCAWDGGRLPTEAEWAYAAAGGDEQRLYPWGGAAPATRAIYACTGDGSAAGDCAPGDLLPVGSRSPAGDGRWGGADLAGNVMEWTLDVYHLAPPVPCVDCADLTPGVARIPRGGSFAADELGLAATTRGGLPPDLHTHEIGFRCVR